MPCRKLSSFPDSPWERRSPAPCESGPAVLPLFPKAQRCAACRRPLPARAKLDRNMPSVTLSGRAFLRLSGKDAETFLQALITTDLPSLPEGEIRPGALLTPQGKILFDFLIRRDGADAFLIETGD